MKKITSTLVIILIALTAYAQDESINGDLTIGKPNDAGTLKIKRGTAGGEVAGTLGFLGGGSEVHNLSIQSTSGGGYITFRTNYGGVEERLRIANNGNIGIGLTSPSKKVDIKLGNDTDFLRIRRYSSSGRSQLVLADENGSENWRIGMTGSGSTGFSFFDGSKNVLHLEKSGNAIFDPMGSVGIGTTSMGSHKLAVEGSIGAREIKVEASGWSDFVFEDKYDLRTLEEVEQHINENGHLPEIPSEAEVTENGINLGEMNAKLLQKIEELTLYLIEQNKQLVKANKNIAELQREVSTLKNE